MQQYVDKQKGINDMNCCEVIKDLDKNTNSTQYPHISFYDLCRATGLCHLLLTVFILYQQTQLLLKLLQ